MNDPQVRGLDLISFLVKPVQRICKYPLLFRVSFLFFSLFFLTLSLRADYFLLLKELLKQAPEGEPDNEELREACITLEKVVEKVNANKRVSESQAKIAELEKSLHLGQEEFTLVAPGRTFVRKGEFKKPLSDPSAKQSPVYAFLLSDLLLLAKNANDVYGKNEYLVYTNIMSMDQTTLKDLPDNQCQYPPSFLMNISPIFTFPSQC
jgi:hypothetical protein